MMKLWIYLNLNRFNVHPYCVSLLKQYFMLLWRCLLLSWVVVYAEYISLSSLIIFVFLCISAPLPPPAPSCFCCLLSSTVWPVWPCPYPHAQQVFKVPVSAVLHMSRPTGSLSMPFFPLSFRVLCSGGSSSLRLSRFTQAGCSVRCCLPEVPAALLFTSPLCSAWGLRFLD